MSRSLVGAGIGGRQPDRRDVGKLGAVDRHEQQPCGTCTTMTNFSANAELQRKSTTTQCVSDELMVMLGGPSEPVSLPDEEELDFLHRDERQNGFLCITMKKKTRCFASR